MDVYAHVRGRKKKENAVLIRQDGKPKPAMDSCIPCVDTLDRDVQRLTRRSGLLL